MAIYKNTPPIVTNGLTFHLDAGNRQSYTSGSTIWSDLSGNLNSGSLVNSPTFDSTNQGTIVFNGTNQYINFGNKFDQTGTNPFSISSWARTNYAGTTPQSIVCKELITPNYTGFQFGYNICTATLGDAGKVGFAVVDNALTIMRRQTVASTLNDNVFRNIVCTYDGTKTRAGMLIYINGILQPTTDTDSTSFAGTLSNSVNFEIGARDTTNQPFSGSIPVVSFYNRVLSAQEIAQNYNALKSRFGLT